MTEKQEKPELIDFKIGTPLEAMWTKVKESRELSIKSLKESLIIEEAILKLSKSKIEESKNET